ncbi:MAG: hypothetical protein M1831_006346 [Alyxoria varia]|nr:MAG: hypothetical protein M1831_006346 [Alyxoria varia]
MSSSLSSITIYAVGVILPALALSTVCLRYYVKTLRSQSFGVDDAFIGIAMRQVICVGLAVMEIWGTSKHYLAWEYHMSRNGNPLAPLLLALENLGKISLANYLLQDLALGLVKLSVLLFYRRIFCGRTFDICSKLLIALVSLWALLFTFLHLFQCGTQFHAIWGPLDERLKLCLDVTPITEAMAITDVVTDGFILILPVPMVLRLQMSRPRKVSIICIFLLGGLAVAAGIIRLLGSRFSLTANKAPQPAGGGAAAPQNPQAEMQMMEAMVRQMSYGMSVMTALIFWTVVELSLSITAACLPTLRPIVTSNGRLNGWVDKVRSKIAQSLGSSGLGASSHERNGYGGVSAANKGGGGVAGSAGMSSVKRPEAKECYFRVGSPSHSQISEFETGASVGGTTGGGGGPWGPSQTRSYARRISDVEVGNEDSAVRLDHEITQRCQTDGIGATRTNTGDAILTRTDSTPTIPVIFSPTTRARRDAVDFVGMGRTRDGDIEMKTYGHGRADGLGIG